MNDSKICGMCKASLLLTAFSKEKAKRDGLQGSCKSCQAKYRIINLERVRSVKRAYDAAMSPEQRLRDSLYRKAWYAADRRRQAAHKAVHQAIKSGALIKQSCSVCGSEKSVAHHESYDHPLDVIWFCQLHHCARHKEMKGGVNDD
jgi:hypothetical protein